MTRYGMPPKWSPWRCEMAIASIAAGSIARLIAGSDEPPQSSRSDAPGAVRWMQACERPPSANAFPVPRKRTPTLTAAPIQRRPSRDLAQPDGPALVARPRGGLGDAQGLERGAPVAGVVGPAGGEEKEVRELVAVRRAEADEERWICRSGEWGHVRLDRVDRRARVEPDRDAVLRAIDLDPDVVPGGVVPRAAHQPDAPVGQAQDHRRRRHVVERRVLGEVAAGSGGVHVLDLEPNSQRVMSKSWMSWSRNWPPDVSTYASSGGRASRLTM